MLGAMHGTYETVDDRPALTFERRLAHPVERVWRAVTDPAELAHWFPSAVSGRGRARRPADLRVPRRRHAALEGEVLELEPPRRFAFTWGDDVLRIELDRGGDGCLLRFTCLFDDPERAARDAAGWHVCLDLLEQHLGGAATDAPEQRAPRAMARALRGVPAPRPAGRGARARRLARRGPRDAVRRWGMADIDLAAVERELRARHDELQERLAGLARPPERGSQVGFGKRIGDGTTEAVSRLTDVGVGGSLEISEARVARALAKLAEGSYGVCDGCGEPIAPARLAAAPESVLCIACARRAH